ncbi:MAG TPA: hypothetical protein VMZ71_00065 [Gemmataceae bacterium]|nr:hypothetical protein [Gemmataceae bacterium]
MTRIAPLLVLLLAPTVVRGDGGPPVGRSIPADVVIEIDREYPEFVFLLESGSYSEVLDFAPGRPAGVSGNKLPPGTGNGWIVVVSATNPADRTQVLGYRVRFQEAVWFYDTRSRVVNTYRLSSQNGEWSLRFVGESKESLGGKLARYAVGLLLSAAAILSVRRVFRRRSTPASG